jgi:multiple sugar transport system permease protein
MTTSHLTSLTGLRHRSAPRAQSLFVPLMLLVSGMLWVFPLVWGLLSSFKPSHEIIVSPLSLLPHHWTLGNYTRVWRIAPFAIFFLNSTVVAFVSTVFVILTSIGAAYAFAKMQFWGKEFFFVLVLATLLIPMETYIVPLFLTIYWLHWVNQMSGLIYPTIIMSSGIFFLRQSMGSISDELLDAARVDGASEFHIVRSIVIPLSIAPIAAISILNWVATWSLFLWPLIVASSDQMFTMQVGLMYFQNQYVTEYGPTMAATVIAMLPVAIVFLLFRTQIIDGVAWTGLK